MNTTEFLEELEKSYASNLAISKRKNADYAGEGDPFKNFKLCEMMGICSVEKGIMVRMCDKMSRIATLLDKNESVLDEKVEDTCADLSNYSMILKVYLQNKLDKTR